MRLIRSHQYPKYQSGLYNQENFYKQFIADLHSAQTELIIESPFLSARRVGSLLPILSKLIQKGVSVYVNTKSPAENDEAHESIALRMISKLQAVGVTVLYTTGHHRKLAIIDESILWEGSLNILSQNDSCELMRRIISSSEAYNMKQFTGISKIINE